ncbi:MAG: hypothetical protein KJ732_00490 [Candidatus Margulisbacteria bacterium]|nr:hypothetical protein [Candidatus Margulisiibacteriota bacterium]
MKVERAKEPFCFITSSMLVEITGKKAHHLKEFIQMLKQIDESSIFYHVHRVFREYSFAPGQYSNDFARWVAEDLEEGTLAEQLASINLRDYTDINSLRAKLVDLVENYLMNAVEIRRAPAGREFYFLRSLEVIIPTSHTVWTLKEFCDALNRVGMRSLYYHFFDARLRLGHKTNDFSNWIRTSLDNEELAQKIDEIDPYFMTMDQLKEKIISLCCEIKEPSVPSLATLFVRLAKQFMGKKKWPR